MRQANRILAAQPQRPASLPKSPDTAPPQPLSLPLTLTPPLLLPQPLPPASAPVPLLLSLPSVPVPLLLSLPSALSYLACSEQTAILASQTQRSLPPLPQVPLTNHLPLPLPLFAFCSPPAQLNPACSCPCARHPPVSLSCRCPLPLPLTLPLPLPWHPRLQALPSTLSHLTCSEQTAILAGQTQCLATSLQRRAAAGTAATTAITASVSAVQCAGKRIAEAHMNNCSMKNLALPLPRNAQPIYTLDPNPQPAPAP